MELDISKMVFSQLQKFLPKQEKIVVGVSGGPDSMALLWLIQNYYTHKKWDQANICIAHYNHGQRKESTQEQKILQKYCQNNTFYWNLETPKKGLGETKLRTMRHNFFDEVMQDSHATKLFLGHNLTDRIETTLLNMVRGSHIQGFLGIKRQTTHTSYTQYRPLIEFPKTEIQSFCEKNSIPYFVDKTNLQNITGRNVIRNTIVPMIQSLHPSGKKNRYTSRTEVFNQVESYITGEKKDIHVRIHIHQPNRYRQATKRLEVDKNDISLDIVQEIFYQKKVYNTKQKLQTVVAFIQGTAQGYMFSGGWYIFKTDNSIHFIDGKKDFWKQSISTHKPIPHSGLLQFDQHIYTMNKERIGYEIRYPQKGDMYKKKPLSKAFIAKKIPVFLRNILPVIAEGENIHIILD